MSGISVPSFAKNLNCSATMKISSGFAFGISGAFRMLNGLYKVAHPNDEVSDQEAERIIREAISRSFQIPYKPPPEPCRQGSGAASIRVGLTQRQCRVVHLEAGLAFIIFRPGLSGVRIDELLPLFLEVTLFENEVQSPQLLITVIFDEIGAGRTLPLVRRQALALPTIVAEAMADKIRQYPELVAVARQLLARVGDQALTLHQPRVVEQHRGYYRELVRRSSGVHPDLRLEVERAR